MFDKLETIELRFNEIESQMSRGDIDGKELTRLSKERASIVDIVEAYRIYSQQKKDREAAKEMLKEDDPEMRSMAKEELSLLDDAIEKSEKELQLLTLPRDPNDDKNVILEVRAGTGGEEASLFSADLLRMYSRYAEKLSLIHI